MQQARTVCSVHFVPLVLSLCRPRPRPRPGARVRDGCRMGGLGRGDVVSAGIQRQRNERKPSDVCLSQWVDPLPWTELNCRGEACIGSGQLRPAFRMPSFVNPCPLRMRMLAQTIMPKRLEILIRSFFCHVPNRDDAAADSGGERFTIVPVVVELSITHARVHPF